MAFSNAASDAVLYQAADTFQFALTLQVWAYGLGVKLQVTVKLFHSVFTDYAFDLLARR